MCVHYLESDSWRNDVDFVILKIRMFHVGNLQEEKKVLYYGENETRIKTEDKTFWKIGIGEPEEEEGGR